MDSAFKVKELDYLSNVVITELSSPNSSTPKTEINQLFQNSTIVKEDFVSDKKIIDKELVELRKKNSELHQKVFDLNKLLMDGLKTEINVHDLQSAEEKLRTELNTLKSNFSYVEYQNTKLNNNIIEITEKFKNEKSQYEEMKSREFNELKSENEKLCSQVQEVQNKNNLILAELNKITILHQSLEKQYKYLVIKESNLESKSQKLTTQVNVLNQALKEEVTLREDAEFKHAEMINIQGNYKSKINEISNLNEKQKIEILSFIEQQSKFTETISRLSSENDKYKIQYSDICEQNKIIICENNQNKIELLQLKEDHAKAIEVMSQFTNDLKISKDELNVKNEESKFLNLKVNHLENELASLKIDVSAKENDYSALTESFELIKSELSKSKQLYDNSQAIITQLQEENSHINNRFVDKNKELSILNIKNIAAQTDLNNYKDKFEKSTELVEYLQPEVESLKNNLVIKDNEICDLLLKYESIKTELSHTQLLHDNLQLVITQLQDEASKINIILSDKNKDLVILNTKNKEMQFELTNYKDKYEKSTQLNSNLQDAILENNILNQEKILEIKKLNARNNVFEEELKSANSKVEVLSNEIMRLSKSENDLRIEFENLKNEYNSKEQQLVDEILINSQYEDAILDFRVQQEESIVRIKNFNAEIKEYQNRLTRANEVYKEVCNENELFQKELFERCRQIQEFENNINKMSYEEKYLRQELAQTKKNLLEKDKQLEDANFINIQGNHLKLQNDQLALDFKNLESGFDEFRKEHELICNELNSKILTYEQSNSILKSNLILSNGKIEELENLLNSLQKSTDQKDQALKTLHQLEVKLELLEKSNSDLYAQVDLLVKEKSDLCDKLTIKNSNFDIEKNKIQKWISQLNNRDVQLKQYVNHLESKREELVNSVHKFSDELAMSARLHPLKDYFDFTEFQISKIDLELRKTPIISANRAVLVKQLEQLVDQKNFLKDAILTSKELIQKQSQEILKLIQLEEPDLLPPMPTIKVS